MVQDEPGRPDPARPQPEAAAAEPTAPVAPAQPAHVLPGCYRHPERETGIGCSRCGRPICPQCMVNASVGFHCPECVSGPAATPTRPATTVFGGRPVHDGALITKILIGINAVVFVLAAYVDKPLQQTLLLYSVGPQINGHLYGVAAGPDQWYRLLTATFLHVQPWHIASNMLALWWMGPTVERVLGRLRYLALYLVSGLAGSALAYLVAGDAMSSLGASGAIFGIFGATVVLYRVYRQPLGPVVALIVFNLVITFSVPGIDWRAHVGGLVAGVLTGIGMMHAPRANRNLVQAGTVVLMLAVVLGMVLVETARLRS
ncbi:membrane associated rhomboid family serine protease [Kitasatospora sp. MAP12-15]|uniref:rhomboid family intramembrane serine protease n=1 Tax=unclassified Kitasatospora TaxID=2633591 RepID=UPI00247356ED|nr:rhomboid family intramembrane serine protease [Kitasatospora sp. MAP12-44]MDH6111954.1 membrane associated rhomboid family serine protease [Kitasatospora sp. MAP12-44]